MRQLENYIMQTVAGSLSKSDFERELYQEKYVSKMSEDRLIEDLININFNDRSWKATLKASALKHFGEENFRSLLIKHTCLRLLDASDKREIFRLNYSLARMNFQFDYQHEWLMLFYTLDDELDFTRSGYGHRSEHEIAKDVQSAAAIFLDQLDK